MKHKHPMTGIWGESLKNVKNEKYTIRICVMVKKLTNVENETQTVYDLEYGEKQ